ncbi:hypothetical protein HMPREF9098_2086 [Kingella denitrificans ATCC 33394]|uniref:Uncharacterized protein n=1 Tax=Kingella denitrificans ATCC 33394 TaxID=888741 RepID=F0F1V1_9NEIS|nr:hypothetical protein HMPREF9098_2086 [Kingella denitrificans ATCC 33394]
MQKAACTFNSDVQAAFLWPIQIPCTVSFRLNRQYNPRFHTAKQKQPAPNRLTQNRIP